MRAKLQPKQSVKGGPLAAICNTLLSWKLMNDVFAASTARSANPIFLGKKQWLLLTVVGYHKRPRSSWPPYVTGALSIEAKTCSFSGFQEEARPTWWRRLVTS